MGEDRIAPETNPIGATVVRHIRTRHCDGAVALAHLERSRKTAGSLVLADLQEDRLFLWMTGDGHLHAINRKEFAANYSLGVAHCEDAANTLTMASPSVLIHPLLDASVNRVHIIGWQRLDLLRRTRRF